MGDIPAGPAGFTRYLMKSKFGAGRLHEFGSPAVWCGSLLEHFVGEQL